MCHIWLVLVFECTSTRIDPGMGLTPFPLRPDSNPRSFNDESSLLPTRPDYCFWSTCYCLEVPCLNWTSNSRFAFRDLGRRNQDEKRFPLRVCFHGGSADCQVNLKNLQKLWDKLKSQFVRVKLSLRKGSKWVSFCLKPVFVRILNGIFKTIF